MLHQWFTCVHLLDTYLANLKEGFQLSFHYPSVSIRAAQSGLQSAPACRMRWVCHHLFRSYDRHPSNIANIRLHSVSGHTIFCKDTKFWSRNQAFSPLSSGKSEVWGAMGNPLQPFSSCCLSIFSFLSRKSPRCFTM